MAIFGVAVCGWALFDGYRDRAEQRRWGFNGAAVIVVGMILRGARASMLLHAFFLLLGIGALLTPDRDFAPTLGFYGASYIQLDRMRMRRNA